MVYTDDQILKAAVAAYECNRAFHTALGDKSQVPWEWLEEFHRSAYFSGAKTIAEKSVQYSPDFLSLKDAMSDSLFTCSVTAVLNCLSAREEQSAGV